MHTRSEVGRVSGSHRESSTAARAEERAGRALFGDVDWKDVVSRFRDPSTGDWIQMMHGVLRRKAREQCGDAEVATITTDDLLAEVEVSRRARKRLPRQGPPGTYL